MRFANSRVLLAIGMVVIVLAATWNTGGSDVAPTSDKPVLIAAGPAGLLSGTAPSQEGMVWLLAKTERGANLQRVRLSSGKVVGIIPLPKEASVISQSFGGYLGVGISTIAAGAVELYGSTGGAVLGTIPVSGKVIDLVAGVDGSTFYAASQAGPTKVLDVISIPARRVTNHIPLPARTVSVAITADQTTLFTLESNGTISVVDMGTSRINQSFPAGPDARHMCITPDGTRLLVLKGPLNASNVSVLDIATQRTTSVVPAPANSRWIVATADSTQVVNFVGTSEMGNVQTFLLP